MALRGMVESRQVLRTATPAPCTSELFGYRSLAGADALEQRREPGHSMERQHHVSLRAHPDWRRRFSLVELLACQMSETDSGLSIANIQRSVLEYASAIDATAQ
jgi:hypothetical protein